MWFERDAGKLSQRRSPLLHYRGEAEVMHTATLEQVLWTTHQYDQLIALLDQEHTVPISW